MKANPGGQIPPDEVIGRDELIQHLWRILERQSLVLSAERRMGKTCIVKKMVAEVPQDKLPIYRDLERIHTPLEFAETLFHDVESYLSRLKRTAKQARLLLTQLSGAELKGYKLPDAVAPHWKKLLIGTLKDLVENENRTVIFFWDEVPLMLDNFKKRKGEDAAMEVLDSLRALRHMYTNLRMVFTGSIGFHNVISSLKRAGYINDPLNDMYIMDVPPLSPPKAQELARLLLEGEGIPTDDLKATAHTIADAVDCFPQYIHHVVEKMKLTGGVMNVTSVDEIVKICLRDPHDYWHLRHYLERIDTYYTSDEYPFALNILDVLVSTEKPLSFEDVFNLLKSRMVTEDREMTCDVLTLLKRDHYIIQQSDGTYCFRFPLIQRWWHLERGLTP